MEPRDFYLVRLKGIRNGFCLLLKLRDGGRTESRVDDVGHVGDGPVFLSCTGGGGVTSL